MKKSEGSDKLESQTGDNGRSRIPTIRVDDRCEYWMSSHGWKFKTPRTRRSKFLTRKPDYEQ